METELRELGLTAGEVKVYLALLKLGSSTNSPIARLAGLQSSTVYYCLNSLIEKGFVSYVQKDGRKHFLPADPENLVMVFDQKEKDLVMQRARLQKILPDLKNQYRTVQSKTVAETFEGFNALQMVFGTILASAKKGDVYEAFVIEQTLDEPRQLALLFEKHNRALQARGALVRLLAPESLRSVFKKMYGIKFLKKYQEIRFTKDKIPVGITLFKNRVITHVFEAGKPVCFSLRNEKLASTYREFFYDAWARAKKF